LISGQLWVTVSGEDRVALVDSASGAVAESIDVGDRPWKVVDGFGAVWVSNHGDGQTASSVVRIDPTSREVGEPIPVDCDAAVDHGAARSGLRCGGRDMLGDAGAAPVEYITEHPVYGGLLREIDL